MKSFEGKFENWVKWVILVDMEAVADPGGVELLVIVMTGESEVPLKTEATQ